MKSMNKKNSIQCLSRAVLLVALCGGIVSEGWAQSGSKGYGATAANNFVKHNSAARFSSKNLQSSVLNRSSLSIGTAGVNRRNFLSTSSVSSSRPTKPFSGTTSRPTVSPYLALSAPRSTASDYYSIIRPQQRRQRENQRQQAFAIQRQRKLNQMAARAPYSPKGDESRMGTGHVAVFQSLGSFQNTANYFPPPSRPKRRR